MSGLYAELNWPTNPFREDWTHPSLSEGQKWWKQDYKPIFKQEISDLAESVGLQPDCVLVFFQKGGVYSRKWIHTDGADGYFRFGVNWILAEATKMQWYSVIPRQYPLVNKQADMKFENFLEDCCEVIGSSTCMGPLLVDVTTPHRADNMGDTDRVAYSLRFKNRFSSWDEMYQVFKPFVKDNDHIRS